MLIRTRMGASIDGYIATPDGLPAFLVMPGFVPHGSYEWPEFSKLCQAVVMGRVALDAGLRSGNWPWPGLQVYVRTSRPLPETVPADVMVGDHRPKRCSASCGQPIWQGMRSCSAGGAHCTSSWRSGRSTSWNSSSSRSCSARESLSPCPARRGGTCVSNSTAHSPTARSITSTPSALGSPDGQADLLGDRLGGRLRQKAASSLGWAGT